MIILMRAAEKVRGLMAKLGFRSVEELIGHADVLRGWFVVVLSKVVVARGLEKKREFHVYCS